MLKVMRIYCAGLDREVDVSRAQHLYKSFEALKSAINELVYDTFMPCDPEIEIKQFSIDPFKPVRYISHDERVIAEQVECQVAVLVQFYGELLGKKEEFRIDVAVSEQADIDAAQKYMRPTSWGHQVNFSKVIRIPKWHRIPSFISSTNSVDKS
ncbi:hypothetical protein [Thiomicrospira sp.]|uniref:hypothetical protein n=1 Tax=Thiomicrospira sp. TaxID=935 RepID=UPI002F944B9E